MHDEVGVSVNSHVTDSRLDVTGSLQPCQLTEQWSAVNAGVGSSHIKGLGFVRIRLESVRLHPAGRFVDTSAEFRTKRNYISRPARAI